MIQIEEEHDQHHETNTKDWFGPAIASMARLNQIQATVHNMGFHTMNSLKVSRSIKKRTKPPLPTNVLSQHNTTPDSQREQDSSQSQIINQTQNDKMLKYTDLDSTPPLSTASYQRTAWGSNHSIPELVAQQGRKMTKLRPSSAKGQNSKLKQSSRGRPQSAKEPLCSDQNEKTPNNIAVCGQRKSLSSTRPPSRGSVPSPNMNTNTVGAWAGLPPGHIMESTQQMQDVESATPNVPPSSPEPGDVIEEVESKESCPQTPPLLRRPLPQPIHLSLPSVSDSADAIREGCQPLHDDMDTQRLLVQADLFVDQQKTKDQEEAEAERKLVSRNTLPEVIGESVESKSNVDPGEINSKGITLNVSNKGQEINHHHTKNKQKHSMFLTPDDNVEQPYQPLTIVEESQRNRTRVKSSPVRSNRESVNTVSKAGVRIREDKNVTVDITPRNVGRKVSDGSSSVSHDRESKSNNCFRIQDKHFSNRKMDKNVVSMVTVEYQTDGVTDSNTGAGNGKLKGRKTKTMGEVETMVSHLSKLSAADDDAASMNENDEISMSQVLHKSEGERNYYEISRSQSRQSVHSIASDSDKNSDKDATGVVYKTTKTIEFDQENWKENSTKMVINSHETPKPKVNVTQKPPKHSSSILPSTIKQQKTTEGQGKHNFIAERKNSKNIVKTNGETGTDIDELTAMLNEAKSMAVTSLYDATRRPSSGKKSAQRPSSGTSEQKTKMRPSSAGSKLQSSSDYNQDKRKGPEKPPRSYPNYMTQTGSSNCCRSYKSAKPTKPVVLQSVKPTIPLETPESDHCKKVQSRMAELGIDVDSRVLEKALFAPAGESIFYEVPGSLPKNPTARLLPHYKYWLSEDYKRIKTMEKRLAQDDHIRYLEKLAAEKKAKKAAAKESKGKKKKKKKLERSNSIV